MKTTTALRPTNEQPLLWNTHHDQPESRRVAMIALLNGQLADVIDLGLQAKQAHWNVKGLQFGPLHSLFDEVAGELAELGDEIAERAVMLGGVARGTLQTLGRDSRLEPFPAEALEEAEMLWALAGALTHLTRSTRAAIDAADTAGDAGTADVLTQASRALDKLLWKIEAHIALEPRWEPAKFPRSRVARTTS